MNKSEIFARAETFLNKRKIAYVKPGEIGEQNSRQIEVIFLVPDALDPNVVIDPSDIRVWVDIYSGEVTLISQM